jgi:hypothetical protein
MLTNNHEGIKRKDVVTIVRVGGIKIIINPRTMLIMRSQIIMLATERKKAER